MSNVMMTLGPIRFELPKLTYDNLSSSMEFRWPVLDRLGWKPARQWIGPGDHVITISGALYPSFSMGGTYTGIKNVEQLRQLGLTGIPYNLTDGTGKAWGMFCILKVEETHPALFSNGAPRKQEFTLELGEYGQEEKGVDGVIQDNGKASMPRMGSGSGTLVA